MHMILLGRICIIYIVRILLYSMAAMPRHIKPQRYVYLFLRSIYERCVFRVLFGTLDTQTYYIMAYEQ